MSKNSRDIARYHTMSGFIHLFLLVIIILVAIGAVGYLAYQNAQLKKQVPQPTPAPVGTLKTTSTPTPDITANWKTYNNEAFNYSVKYSPELKPTKYTDNDIYLDFVGFGDSTNNSNWFSITVRRSSLEEEISYVKNIVEGHVLTTLTQEKEMVINGYPAMRLDYEPDNPSVGRGITTHIIVSKENYSFTINSKAEIVDQILSTFEFLDEYRSSEEYLRVIAQNEILKYPGLVSEGYGSYQVESINIKDNWAAINYTSFSLTPASPDAHIVVPNIVLGAGRLTNDAWTVYIQNTEKFDSIKNDLPNWLQFLK